jgi:pimeloyl-ACP methyl ester carboxylesterase
MRPSVVVPNRVATEFVFTATSANGHSKQQHVQVRIEANRDTDPIVNWVKLSPAELPNYIFRNPAAEAAQQLLGPLEPPDAAIAARVRLMWAMGATSKFIWPIPDKGLKKRIHRVSAPTLIVWGADDRLVPSVYADEFSKRLARARIHIITGAGHAPHLEHPASVAGLVRDFLTATSH